MKANPIPRIAIIHVLDLDDLSFDEFIFDGLASSVFAKGSDEVVTVAADVVAFASSSVRFFCSPHNLILQSINVPKYSGF